MTRCFYKISAKLQAQPTLAVSFGKWSNRLVPTSFTNGVFKPIVHKEYDESIESGILKTQLKLNVFRGTWF